MKTGVAELPLHTGKAPAWLFSQMRQLVRQIVVCMVGEFGPVAFLERLSDPYWFQALGCVLGYDWHSSGLTTVTCAAIKEALEGLEKELDIFVAGGKGRVARKTPLEIQDFCQQHAHLADHQDLARVSRLAAKVDSACLQDGYQLYHHCFFFTSQGAWAVIQQGMNTDTRWARRYHWWGPEVKDFVCEPHKAVCCDHRGNVLNMVAQEADASRKACARLSCLEPEDFIRDLGHLQELKLPSRHTLYLSDVDPRRIKKALLVTYETQPAGFRELIELAGVGPKTIRSLALVAEIIYGAPVSWRDPARFAFAHGGKDGYPYPIQRGHYQKTIKILQKAIREAKVGQTQKLKALSRLARWEG